MAVELNIRGTQDEVKLRNPWVVAGLSIITLGIYTIFWWYYVNREMRDYGEAKGTDLGQNPTNSALAVFPGSLIVIPPLISFYNGFKRAQKATELAGRQAPNGWIGLILYLIFYPAFAAYLQVSLNEVWESEADPLGGAPAAPVEPETPLAPAAPVAAEGSIAPEPPATPEAPPEPPQPAGS
jgi:Domain of unknown function (DUF4234)